MFGDRRDLGYGRRMTARRNPLTGDIAFIVENYQVDPGGVYGFSALSIEAAVRQDTRWRILINAIEYSPATPGGVAFAKFFNFNPVTGAREFQVDLDGRGKKFMPGPCLTCHGGRGDGSFRIGFGNLLFPVVHNSMSQAPGAYPGASRAPGSRPLRILSSTRLHAAGTGGETQDDELVHPLLVSPSRRELARRSRGLLRAQTRQWE